jgi:PhzF family phenazine biosynthesis protein
MELKIYQVDAFSSRLFGGNAAAVCPLQSWLSSELMQQIAMENNLAETAFFVQEQGGLRIRWFTPKREVKLCGHATLAAAWVYFHHIETDSDEICFNSLSGPLAVTRRDDTLTLDSPVSEFQPVDAPEQLIQAIGIAPLEVYAGEDWLLRLDSEQTVRTLQPDMRLLQQLELRGLIVTAEGDDCDFVSRFFAPNYGIDEDPVTGSAHTLLAPFWAERLHKERFVARQLSARGGELYCELRGERVHISGQVTPYLQGVIHI